MADITLDGLGKRFGAVTAVEDLSLEIKPGNVTAFLGPNGADKTTTMRMVLGLVRPTSGRALIGGRPYSQLPEPRRAVGAVLGPDGFHPGRPGRDHLRVIARAARSRPAGSTKCSSWSSSPPPPTGASAPTRSGCVSASGSRTHCSATPVC